MFSVYHSFRQMLMRIGILRQQTAGGLPYGGVQYPKVMVRQHRYLARRDMPYSRIVASQVP